MYNTSVQHILWSKPDEMIVVADTKKSGFNLFTFKLSNLNGSMQLTKQLNIHIYIYVLIRYLSHLFNLIVFAHKIEIN